MRACIVSLAWFTLFVWLHFLLQTPLQCELIAHLKTNRNILNLFQPIHHNTLNHPSHWTSCRSIRIFQLIELKRLQISGNANKRLKFTFVLIQEGPHTVKCSAMLVMVIWSDTSWFVRVIHHVSVHLKSSRSSSQGWSSNSFSCKSYWLPRA